MRAEKGSLPRVESPGTYWEPGMTYVKDAFRGGSILLLLLTYFKLEF